MRDIRAILFDAGGTLIHMDGERTTRSAGLAWDPAAFGRSYDEAVADMRRWVVAHPKSTDSERMPRFLGALLSGLGVPEEARRESVRGIVAEHLKANLWSRGAEDAPATLAALKGSGYRLAVVSNADGRVRALLSEAGLTEHFEFVVDSAEVGVEKPARIFRAATDRLELPPASCAYVGDIYEIDVLGARAAGLEAILIGNCEAPADVPRVGRLTELLALFSG